MHPVAFESKKLSAAERNYPAQERELLGIQHALRACRCFVEGRSYVVYTDHHPLRYFRTQKKPTPRLTRWIAEMELYDPNIQYKPGRENHIPDLLSRRDGSDCPVAADSLEPDYLYAVKAIQESDWPKFYTRPESAWPDMYKDHTSTAINLLSRLIGFTARSSSGLKSKTFATPFLPAAQKSSNSVTMPLVMPVAVKFMICYASAGGGRIRSRMSRIGSRNVLVVNWPLTPIAIHTTHPETAGCS